MAAPQPGDIDLPPTVSVDLSHLVDDALRKATSATVGSRRESPTISEAWAPTTAALQPSM